MRYTLLGVSILALLILGCGIKEKTRMEPQFTPEPPEYARLYSDIKVDYPVQGVPAYGYNLWINGQKVDPNDIEKEYDIGKEYRFKIQKPGYNTLKGKFYIPKEVRTYSLEKMLISKHRTVRFYITDQQSGKNIIPDKVYIGGREVVDGTKVKPGKKSLEIYKKGYQSIAEDFELKVGEGEKNLSRKMLSGVVKLTFHFYDYDTQKKIKADKIYLNRKRTLSRSYEQPGQYRLLVKKNNYKTYIKSIHIPDAPAYTIKVQLQRKSIKLNWKITGDYPRGEEFIPEVVKIDGKDVYIGEGISSGIHEVLIQNPGYKTYRKKIVVPDGISRYTLKAELKTLPREITTNIRYDIPPSAQNRLGFCKVRLWNIRTNEKILFRPGLKLKPQKYEILITQYAYEFVKQVVVIWPRVNNFEIKATMQALTRCMKLKVRFDIPPPNHLKPWVIDFISDKGVARTAKKGGRVKPGRHRYIVRKEGYKMVGEEKTAYIEPSEEPCDLGEVMLRAIPRQFVFYCEDGKLTRYKPSITINKKAYFYHKEYQPGKKYSIVAKFKKFKTIKKDIILEPGVGPRIVKFALIPK